MTDFSALDFEPNARQVYDDFLVSLPDVPVEGLFALNGRYFIVSPALKTPKGDGRTVAEWFEHERLPLGLPIRLAQNRPDGAVELATRSAEEVCSGYGVVRTLADVSKELAVRLPKSFPLVSTSEVERTLVVTVSRPLSPEERARLDSVLASTGDPLPLEVRIDTGAGFADQMTTFAGKLELVPVRACVARR